MSDLPTSIRSGTLSLFGVNLRVHVLSNGQRVIEQKSMAELFAAMEKPCDTKTAMQEAERFARWMRGMDEAQTPPLDEPGTD